MKTSDDAPLRVELRARWAEWRAKRRLATQVDLWDLPHLFGFAWVHREYAQRVFREKKQRCRT
jgi:hypothetical protein